MVVRLLLLLLLILGKFELGVEVYGYLLLSAVCCSFGGRICVSLSPL
jgi:hypothetical protein